MMWVLPQKSVTFPVRNEFRNTGTMRDRSSQLADKLVDENPTASFAQADSAKADHLR